MKWPRVPKQCLKSGYEGAPPIHPSSPGTKGKAFIFPSEDYEPRKAQAVLSQSTAHDANLWLAVGCSERLLPQRTSLLL